MTCQTSRLLPEETFSSCECHFLGVLRFDIVTIGNGFQPPGNGGCKVGNVYIATTLLSSYSLQNIRIPALPMASPGRKWLAYYLASLFRIHESAWGLGLFGVAGDGCLFKQVKHLVRFIGETAYHMWQLVKSWCWCFHISTGLNCFTEIEPHWLKVSCQCHTDTLK